MRRCGSRGGVGKTAEVLPTQAQSVCITKADCPKIHRPASGARDGGANATCSSFIRHSSSSRKYINFCDIWKYPVYSGATTHMCNDASLFSHMSTISSHSIASWLSMRTGSSSTLLQYDSPVVHCYIHKFT